MEGVAIAGAFFKDSFPVEACLGAFEDEYFEEFLVVVLRDAPFVVVVMGVFCLVGFVAEASYFLIHGKNYLSCLRKGQDLIKKSLVIMMLL